MKQEYITPAWEIIELKISAAILVDSEEMPPEEFP